MSPAMLQGQDSMEYQKGVKHMCDAGIQHVPRKYILDVDERPGPGKSSEMETDIALPVIDFAELRGSDRGKVINSLANACENYGFFQLVNHGIPDDVITDVVDVSRRFFELPLAEREKYMSADTSSPVRYGTSFNQANDGVHCWRDFLKLVCHPLQDVLHHWPSSPLDFRQLVITYSKAMKLLSIMIMEAILESLGLKDEDESVAMLNELKNGSQLMVLNCYPPCPEPDLTLGMPPHSDYGLLTLLLQDEVKGLQIQHKDKWFTIRPVLGSFIVNIGDHLEIFSNGRYKSVLHRVLVNSTKNRISVASFHSLPFTSIVRPSPMLIDALNPRRYLDTDFACFMAYIKSCDLKKKNFIESRKVKY